MKELVYNGSRDFTIKDVADARIEQSADVLVRITTTIICGSDLHMHEQRTDLELGPLARDPRRARADLVAAVPGAGPRVIDIAYRWGFSHPGRFATLARPVRT